MPFYISQTLYNNNFLFIKKYIFSSIFQEIEDLKYQTS